MIRKRLCRKEVLKYQSQKHNNFRVKGNIGNNGVQHLHFRENKIKQNKTEARIRKGACKRYFVIIGLYQLYGELEIEGQSNL